MISISPLLPFAAIAPEEIPRMEPYGLAHILVLLLTVGIPLLLRWWVLAGATTLAERQRRLRPVGITLAVILLGAMPTKLLFTLSYYPRPWQEILPLQLCDVAAVLIAIALLTYRQWAFELAYYWGLAGTLQALLTPDLAFGFPHPYFIFFFIGHAGIVVGALTLTLAGGMRPTVRGIWHAFAALLGYALAVYFINVQLDVNYGYLRAKPLSRSLLDLFWDWPFYIAQVLLVALVLFFLFYLPHAPFWRRRGKKNANQPSTDGG